MSVGFHAVRSAAAATLVAGLLVVAPVAGGAVGAAARAQEPAIEAPDPVPSDEVSPVPVELIEPEVVEDVDPAAVEAESDAQEAEAAEGEPEATEPEPTEPETTEPALPDPATASALQSVAAPVALVEELEEAPGLPSFVGADGCTYLYIEQEGSIGISDIFGCTDVVVPSQIDGVPVETIGASSTAQTMSGAGTFTSLVLPDSLFFVGQAAFAHADALTSVDFGTGVQRILARAFVDSDALTSVDLPPSVERVGTRAFENAASVASIDLGSVEIVGPLAFSGAGQVTELVVPASINRADDTAFGNMPHLRSVLIEGDPTALIKHTFVNSPALEEVEFHSRSTSATVVNTMFQGANLPEVFFRDGAFGKQCGPVPVAGVLSEERLIGLGGTQVRARCLFDVTFNTTGQRLTLDVEVSNVRERTVVTDVPEAVAPEENLTFIGYSPSVDEPVVEDTDYVAQFAAIAPEPYIPSEDDLVGDAQCCFTVPDTVRAGEELTLTITEEPNPSGTAEPEPVGTPEPLPGGTLEPNPGGTPPANIPDDLELVPQLELPEDELESPAEDIDPNEFIDIWLFSEPVEILITGFTGGDVPTSITVLIPADVEPGEHKVAVFSVFGDVIAWQPITVLAAEGPAGAPPAGEGDGGDGGADGDTDGGGAGSGQTGAAPTSANQGAVIDADLPGALSATGPTHTALAVGGATALIVIGGLLILARRFS